MIVEQVEPQIGTAVERCVAREALRGPPAKAVVATDECEIKEGSITPDLPASGPQTQFPAPNSEWEGGGASPGGWHTGYGGGIWLALRGTRSIVSAAYAESDEDKGLYINLGFSF